MPPRILTTDASSIDEAGLALARGELVILPTDTVYGIAASIAEPAAVARIFQAKGRPADRPIALLVDRIEDVELVAREIPEIARRLMERFWPGGLTIVLWRKPSVPEIVAAGGPTIAVRMPDHPVPRAIVRFLGEPLPTTSANLSGQPSPIDLASAVDQLGSAVTYAIDGGPAPGGIDSTVIDLTTTPPTLLRAGPIPRADLESAVNGPLKSPG